MRQRSLSRFWLIAPVLIAFLGLSAHAQTPDAGSLQQELQKQAPKPPALPMPAAPAPKAKPKEAKPGEVKVNIQGFKVDGNQSLSDEAIKQVLKPWLGITVTFDELQKAADAVASLYQLQGRLAQVSVPPQKITDGVVILKVLEAKLGAVHVDMPNGPSRFGADRARQYITDASRIGDMIQTQNVERSIYIINETPGIAVSTQLEPGINEGDVDLRVSLADTNPVKGRIEGNNHGSRSTGVVQRVINLTFDNPGTFGDQFSISNIKSSGSDYSLASYSLPLNTDGLRVGVSASYLDYENVGKFGKDVSDLAGFGRSHTIGMNFSYPLERSPASNSNVTAGFDRKMYLNKKATDGSYNSDYRIDNMTIGFNGNHYDAWGGGGVNTAGVVLTKGHIVFGSENPENYGLLTPTTFTKYTLFASRTQQLVPDETILNLKFSGQIATVDLDSAEKFYLGGPNGVRGYPGSQAGGSQGAMVNIEIEQALEDKVVAIAFFDAGFVQQYKDAGAYKTMKGRTGANNSYSLRSVGAGLKRSDKDIIWSTSIAWKLGHNPLLSGLSGQGINNDGRSNSAYLWAQVQWIF